ncbi:hypothetical protein [Catenuloplanes japonicus]|nr:hypothetical protein [Catenuloplanes japonicus]
MHGSWITQVPLPLPLVSRHFPVSWLTISPVDWKKKFCDCAV